MEQSRFKAEEKDVLELLRYLREMILRMTEEIETEIIQKVRLASVSGS